MLRQTKPDFPVGSMIVKEKLLRKDAGAPELLTAMIKREPGYNPASGDWEYVVLDGPGRSIEGRGKLANCQSCHALAKDTGYVFRSYLPKDVLGRPIRPPA